MENDIARKLLSAGKLTKSELAYRLGISRPTLWKMLNGCQKVNWCRFEKNQRCKPWPVSRPGKSAFLLKNSTSEAVWCANISSGNHSVGI